jgi:hypothetical protein
MVISERWSNFLEIVAGSHLYSLRLPRRLSPKSVTFYRIITIKNNHVRSYLVIGWIHIFPHMGFKGSSNFRKFVQMFVAHLGNVCHCEISLEASSVVKFLVAQYRLKAHTDRTRFGNATRIFSFQWHLTLIFFNVFQIFGTT